MQYTDVYNLKKPDLNDLPTIRDINENMEVIEEALPSYIKVLYGETVPTSRIPGKYYLISLDETNTNYRVEDGDGNTVHSETNGDLVITDMGSLNEALADVKQHQTTCTPFCVNNGSIDSNGDENLLYTDNSTGVSEVEFIQPVLTANGTLGGNSFAVGGSSNTWLAFDGNIDTYIQETTRQLTIDMYNPTPILLRSIGLTTALALDCKATIFVRNEGEWQVVGTYPLRSLNGSVEQVYTVNNLSEKYKYIRLQLDSNGDFEAFLISRIRLGATVSESVTVGSSLLKFRGGITGTSASRKAFTLNSIAPRDVTGLNGDLNVFVSEVGLVEFLGEVYNQRVEPTDVNEFDIWLNNLEPMSAKVRRNNTWVNYEGVPVGSISVANGVIQSVYTNPYNQNGYNINTNSVATPTTFGVMRTTSSVDEQNCTCSDCAITPSSFYNLSNFRKADWSYSVNDIVGVPYHANLVLKCVKAGTTSSNPLNTTGHLYTNQQITDGSVTWQVLDMLTVSANDPNAVHKTGDETINGNKTFTDNIIKKNSALDLQVNPSSDQYNSFLFADKKNAVMGYLEHIQMTTGVNVMGLHTRDKNNGTHGFQVTSEDNIIPLGDGVVNLGLSGAKWKNVYASTFNGNLKGNADNGVDSYGEGWIRFKNGIQMCWRYGVHEETISFSKAFISNPRLICTPASGALQSLVVNFYNKTPTQFTCRLWNVHTGGWQKNGAFDWVAIGTWK